MQNVDEIGQNEKPTQSSSMFGTIIQMSLHAFLDHIHKHSWHLPQASFSFATCIDKSKINIILGRCLNKHGTSQEMYE